MSSFEKHINIDQDIDEKAASYLAGVVSCKVSQLKLWMKHGAVWLSQGKHTRRLRRGDYKLKAGDTVSLYINEGIQSLEPLEPGLIVDKSEYSILYRSYIISSHYVYS